MPSQPFDDTGWGFSPVLDLIDSNVHDIGSPGLRRRRQTLAQDETDDIEKSDNGVRLGSFSKLFEQLGLPVGSSVPPLPPLDPDSELSNSDDALLPSPIEDTLILKPKPKENAKSTKNSRNAKTLSVITAKEEPDLLLKENEQQKPISSQTSLGSPKKKKHQARKEVGKERKEKKLAEKEQDKNEKAPKAPVVDTLAKRSSSPSKVVEQTAPVPVRTSVTKTGSQSPTKSVNTLARDPSSRSQSLEQSVPTPAPKSGAQSPTKVGAKVRPTTPVQIKPPIHKRKNSGRQDKSFKDNKPSVLPIATELFASQYPNLALQNATTQLFSPQTVVPNGYTQYNPFGTPTPYQHPLSPEALMQLQSSGVLYTPMVPVGQINGLIPSVVHQQISQSCQSKLVSYKAPVPATPNRQPMITIRSQVDRHFQFLNQLMLNFPEDKKWLVSPMQLCTDKTAAEGIHIFVDASNIMYGFKYMLRQYPTISYDMSFDTLALLMERRRPVAKRVFAGSHREANPLPHITKLVETSKAVGYESNVNEQVFIAREETERKKFFKNVRTMGWDKAIERRTGSESDSEAGPSAPTPTAPKWVEQGVDEILHLKMCQSIIDTELPTTMVLATGDGAEAEHSDGFLAHVERALKKGWKVELVSWRQQTNGGYKNRKFRTKWGEQFKIIELDEYLESLIDTP